jgi:dUTP pyrophosphatase
MGQLSKDEIVGYIERLKQLENDLSSGEMEDTSFLNDLNHILGRLSTEYKEMEVNSTSDLLVRVKRLHPNAVIPSYSKDGDAGMDLTIVDVKEDDIESITYGFGIAMEIPKGYVGLIFPRSSVRNYKLILSNCVGVIDSGYRGEIMATFKKTMNFLDTKKYHIGDRGAQILILPYPKVRMVESEDLTNTERNTGGFGHTGK